MSSSSDSLIHFDLFLLLCTLVPPTSQRSHQVPWFKCVTEMFYMQINTHTHTRTHTLRRRQQALGTLLLMMILEMFLANSFQPFSSLVGVAREQIYLFQTVQIPECSSTHRKIPEHRTKETSPEASSFLPCGWRCHILHVSEVPLTQQIHKLNISLNWAQMICPLL